jgi:phosphatidylglycerophosphate synthase
MRAIPWSLVVLRLVLTVPAVWMGMKGMTGWPYTILLLVAAASDYFDGALARKLGTETSLLRQWDSFADVVFFLGVLGGMYFAVPFVFLKYRFYFMLIPALECVRYVFDYIKFGKGAAYHSWCAKAFGVAALAACLMVMGTGKDSLAMVLALFLGVVSELEGFAISVILKDWTYNVKHIFVALRCSR